MDATFTMRYAFLPLYALNKIVLLASAVAAAVFTEKSKILFGIRPDIPCTTTDLFESLFPILK